MPDNFLIIAPLFKIAYGLIAVALVYWVMRAVLSYSAKMDSRAGVSFKDSMAVMQRSPLALGVYKGLRILGLMILAGCLCLMVGMLASCSAQAGTIIPDRYDRQIAKAVETYWPAYPFPDAWKAQLYQESRLDPDAVSPVGAAGLAQIMPGTFAQIVRELRLPPGLSPHSEMAVDWGAYYMARQHAVWRAPRPWDDRHKLAQASYNAGAGHIIAAQARCGDPPGYQAIIRCLPEVTGKHARETITYVIRIAQWRHLIEAGG